MANPQQPELARSRKTPHQDQDSVAAIVEGQQDLSGNAPRGPVPPENQPGNHPEQEQDKPDLDAFAERFGTGDGSGAEDQPSERRPGAADRPEGTATGARSAKPGVFAAAGAAAVSVVAAVGVLTRKRRRARGH